MLFKGCLIDLDDTLYDYNQAHGQALQTTVTWLMDQLSLPREQVEELYHSARQEINTELEGQAASHSRLLYFQRLCEKIKYSRFSLALEAEDRYWSMFLSSMKLRQGALPLLRGLKENKIPCVVVTDLTAQIQLRKLVRLGLEELVTAVVSSEEAGKEKPTTRIFLQACGKISVAPGEAFMVGDSYQRDIEGALAAGLTAFWLVESKSPDTNYGDKCIPVASLLELADVLGLNIDDGRKNS